MTISERARVVGVFRDANLARQAVDELRRAGWDENSVRIIGQNSGSGGIFSSLRNAFSGSQSTSETTTDDPTFTELTEEQRNLYQHELSSGSTLVVADPFDRGLEVRDVLQRYGGYNIFLPSSMGGERAILLRQEVAQVSKQVAVVGEIRIHKRVITENKTFVVPVTREEVTIERVPIDPPQPSAPPQPADPPAGTQAATFLPTQPPPFSPQPQPPIFNENMLPPNYQGAAQPLMQGNATVFPNAQQLEDALRGDGQLRILVHEEQVFIQKQPVVVEEILIRKQTLQEERHLVEPVRHEEVRVERVGNVIVHDNRAQTSDVEDVTRAE